MSNPRQKGKKFYIDFPIYKDMSKKINKQTEQPVTKKWSFSWSINPNIPALIIIGFILLFLFSGINCSISINSHELSNNTTNSQYNAGNDNL